MVLTGCKTYLDCILACNKIVQVLRIHLPGIVFSVDKINVQNIVGNADLHVDANHFLDLNQFYSDNNIFCTYQPNMFPGLIYRPQHAGAGLLMFYSGKIVITGAKKMQDVHDGWSALHDLVKSYVAVKPD